MFPVASRHFPAVWGTNSFVQFKCHVDHQLHGAVGHITIPTRAAIVRPVLDCASPQIVVHQHVVKAWQESSGEVRPLLDLQAMVGRTKVAPSAQLGAVVKFSIAVIGHEMSDVIHADEKPDAILEQESPLGSCISFCPLVGPRASVPCKT